MKPLSPVPISIFTDVSPRNFLAGHDRNLKETCKDFESIFIKQMIKGMRRTVIKSGLFEESNQKDIYQDMFDQQVAREIARGKGIGLGDKLYKSLSKKQNTGGGTTK